MFVGCYFFDGVGIGLFIEFFIDWNFGLLKKFLQASAHFVLSFFLSFVSWYCLLILLLWNFKFGNIKGFQEMPFFMARTFLEEIEENHVIEFKTFCLINSQTQSVLKHSWYFLFTFLISNNNDLIASKLKRTFLDSIVAFFRFFLFPTAKNVEKQFFIIGR